jgi:hypothetical protein
VSLLSAEPTYARQSCDCHCSQKCSQTPEHGWIAAGTDGDPEARFQVQFEAIGDVEARDIAAPAVNRKV